MADGQIWGLGSERDSGEALLAQRLEWPTGGEGDGAAGAGRNLSACATARIVAAQDPGHAHTLTRSKTVTGEITVLTSFCFSPGPSGSVRPRAAGGWISTSTLWAKGRSARSPLLA